MLNLSSQEEKEIKFILEYCIKHVMNLSTCADILELMGPVCTVKSPSGAIEWLKEKINLELYNN